MCFVLKFANAVAKYTATTGRNAEINGHQFDMFSFTVNFHPSWWPSSVVFHHPITDPIRNCICMNFVENRENLLQNF